MNYYVSFIVYKYNGGNMKKRKRVSPTIDVTDEDILSRYNIKPSLAIKQRATQLVMGDNTLAVKEEMLKEKKAEYLKDIAILNERVAIVDAELQNISSMKQNFEPVENINFDKALGEVIRKLRSVMEADENNEWDLDKVKLKEIQNTCNSYDVSVESVMSQVHPNLRRYVEGYINKT